MSNLEFSELFYFLLKEVFLQIKTMKPSPLERSRKFDFFTCHSTFDLNSEQQPCYNLVLKATKMVKVYAMCNNGLDSSELTILVTLKSQNKNLIQKQFPILKQRETTFKFNFRTRMMLLFRAIDSIIKFIKELTTPPALKKFITSPPELRGRSRTKQK